MDDVRIRAAGPEDAPHILPMLRALARQEGLEDVLAVTEADLRAWLEPDDPRLDALVAVAEGGGPPLGYTTFMTRFSAWRAGPYVYLDDVFVRPEARGRGIGTRLIRAVARIAVERRQHVWWDASPGNDRALALYRSLGARLHDVVACRWDPPADV